MNIAPSRALPPHQDVPILVRRAPATLLAVDGLTRRFRAGEGAAVEGVSFSVLDGELLALLGPSGCGKTTTLRMIGGFETPDAGRIRLRERDITALPPEKRGIGFVFQDYALFPHLSVLDNVMFGLRGRPLAKRLEWGRDILAMVGLADLGPRFPHELSGGQQQRAALARTLAVAPPLVLLDEPFSNLDAAMRVETRQEVRAMLKAAGSSAILVTHDQEEALALADRIAVMEGGRLRQLGTPAQIYREPVSEFVASFIGRSNIIRGQANGASAETIFGNLDLSREAAGDVTVAVRPEQITLHPSPDAKGVIVGREFRGHDQLYWVRANDRTVLVIAGPVPIIEIGTRVRLEVCDCVVPLAGA
ncbi:ABC transporter ATP-binding protein [soil metagenome]